MGKENIKPKKFYSSAAIVEMQLENFPWASKYTFNEKLNDPKWQKIFKPFIEQHENSKTYKIKGENIIRFLKAVERGEVNI